jgi:hypothetical protein
MEGNSVESKDSFIAAAKLGGFACESARNNLQSERAAYPLGLLAKLLRPSRLRSMLSFVAVWVASGVYLRTKLMRGWIPHDDGLLAQSAERVLQGQLPHRDFVELYTGGLSYLHALAFRAWGVNLGSLRWMLFLFFLIWVPVLYFLAAELTIDWAAAGLTLLAVVWSVPNYTASMPSWYNLFFATFGVAALFCYVRRPRTRWLFAAGICGGLSFLVKSVGIYYIAGVLLFFVYREQSGGRTSPQRAAETSRAYSGFVTASLLAFVLSIGILLQQQFDVADLFHFVLPNAALAAFLMVREWSGRGQSHASAERFQALFRMVMPFLAGIMIPVALFLILYLRAHAMPDFFNGVFALPAKRLLGAFSHPPNADLLLFPCTLAVLIDLGFRKRGRERAVITGVFSLSGLSLLVASFRHEWAYGVLWETVRVMIPVVTAIGVAVLYYHQKTAARPAEPAQQRLMILVSVCATCSLVQVPFAVTIYFCYVAPLALLAAAAVLVSFKEPPRLLLATTGTIAFLFAALIMRPGAFQDLGWHYSPNQETAQMVLPRAGGLHVFPETAAVYDELIPLIRQHAKEHPILAGPDCPEVYFLGGFENPTRTTFEMFEEREGYRERIEALIEDRSIKVMVVNSTPGFSRPFLDPLRNVALEQFPSGQQVGSFEVRWRP